MKKILFITVISTMIASCDEKASFELVDENKGQAKANALYNAKLWRNDHLPDADIYNRGDSTISSDCPSGDGWATIDLRTKNTTEAIEQIKCSTLSVNEGCHTTSDFKERKQLSKQDGACLKNAPKTFPKLQQ